MIDRAKLYGELAEIMPQYDSYEKRTKLSNVLADLAKKGIELSINTLAKALKDRPEGILPTLTVARAGAWLGDKPVITTTTLPEGAVGQPYRARVKTTGGKAPRKVRIVGAKKAGKKAGRKVPVRVEGATVASGIAAVREEIETHRNGRITICFGKRAICDGLYNPDVVMKVLNVLEA